MALLLRSVSQGQMLKHQIRHFSSIKQQKLISYDPKELKKLSKDLQDLTKFKLSLLNSIGAYSMFYFYAPLAGVGALNSAIFIFATQAVAMSSQCFGQIAES
jgi:hypothetical protein